MLFYLVHITRFHMFFPVWHIWKMPRKCQIKKKSQCGISMLFQALQLSCLGDINGKAAVSSVYFRYALNVISWWTFWLLNLQLLQEQWWFWLSSFEVIKLSTHLCSNFHSIFKGHRILLIFVPLHFYLLRDLLSSWTWLNVLKHIFQKLASERRH